MQNKLKKILGIFIFTLVFVGFSHVPVVDAAASEPNFYGSGAYDNSVNIFSQSGYYGQCTWYAWGRAYELTGEQLGALSGPATDWWSQALTANYTTSSTPRENSIVVFNYGHVAFVESFDGTNIVISEANQANIWDWMTFDEGVANYDGRTTYTVDSINVHLGGVTGYIYVGADPAPRDTEAPTVSNVRVTKTKIGYTMTCHVADNVGVTTVKFPTWLNGVGDIKWVEGTINGNEASYTVKYADFFGTSGRYLTDVYAYDAAGNMSTKVRAADVQVDVVDPKITSAEIIDVTGNSYIVRVVATDNVGVSKVKFSTWTTANGKDDVVNVEQIASIDNIYTYKVNIADHDNESGMYNTKVSVYDDYGNHSDVSLSEAIYPVLEVKLNKTTATLFKGQNLQLIATFLPENTTGDTTITWESSDPEVATVEDGKVIALKEGTTTITATIDGVEKSCVVTVKEIPLDSIQIDRQEVTLFIGESLKLNVLFNPTDTTDETEVSWSSSDESIVSIAEDGTIIAKKAGTVTITAKVGDKTATATVTVDEPVVPNTADINILPFIISIIVSLGGIVFIVKKRMYQ